MNICQISQQYFSQVCDIFFESSAKKNFQDQKQKDAFRYKYLDYYYEKHPHLFFVMLEDNKVLGYVCGVEDSKSCEELYCKISHYTLFEDYFHSYSAHLHMNTHHLARGKGVGANLMEHFINKVKPNSSGLHIITSPHARNVHFYAKNGFAELSTRDFKGNSLLLMGLKFNS